MSKSTRKQEETDARDGIRGNTSTIPQLKCIHQTFCRNQKNIVKEKHASSLSCSMCFTFFFFSKTWLFCWNEEKEETKKNRNSGISPVTFPEKEAMGLS